MCSRTLSALALRNLGQRVKLGAASQIARISGGNPKSGFFLRGVRNSTNPLCLLAGARQWPSLSNEDRDTPRCLASTKGTRASSSARLQIPSAHSFVSAIATVFRCACSTNCCSSASRLDAHTGSSVRADAIYRTTPVPLRVVLAIRIRSVPPEGRSSHSERTLRLVLPGQPFQNRGASTQRFCRSYSLLCCF
jgi:hypothetical protein